MSFLRINNNKFFHLPYFLILSTIILVVFLNLFLITPAHAVTDTICPLKTNQDFETGDIHEDIRSLQKYLNNNGYILASSGPGSPGNETNYFGSVTKSALIKFQNNNNIAVSGVLDLITRNYLNCNNKTAPFIFKTDFKQGDVHEDIRDLQKYLNNNGFILAQSGPGSPGRETNYFGTITKLTLIKFQQVNGLIATGNLDLATRNKINKVSGGGSSAPVVSPTPTPPPVITPTPDTLYSISGSLTGCIGPITIKNNGKDNINIKVGDSSNFTFPTKLSNNSTYNVTVETSYPGQVCYINKSVGIIADNNITDLKIACGLNLTYDPFKYIPSSGGARVVTYLLSYTALSNGSVIGETSQTVNQGTDGSEVIAVADSNYHFVSWSDGITTANRTDTNITDNLSVTASFAINTYLVTFKDHDGTILSTSTVNHGSDASTPIDPTRTGYTFTGWDTAYTNITTTTIITAQYSINSFTVTFEDYNSSTLKTESVNYGYSATAPADPTRIGYTFTGWDVAFNNITSDLTVTAQYSINQYTISFNSDGGSVVSSITQDYDTAITPPADPTKTGHTFSAWSPTIPATMPASNTTHTAIWNIDSYAVTFLDHDDNILKTETVDHGSGATAPADPTRTGYTFTGWDIAFNNVTSDLTVTAQYSINTFTVNYTAGTGGTISGDTNQTVDYNSSTSQVVAVPNSGYTFTNWNDLITNPIRIDSNITNNATYTARFGILTLNAISDYTEGDIFDITWSSQNVNTITISYNDGTNSHTIASGVSASLGTYSFNSSGTGNGTYSFTISDDSGIVVNDTFSGVIVGSLLPENVLFVKADATGNNSGSSWTNAYTTLQAAIDAATPGKQIWVAAGTYRPTTEVGGTGDKFKTFVLKKDVSIYGGFDAMDYVFENRTSTNETILEGLHSPGVQSYNVLYGGSLNITKDTVYDTLIIQNGYNDSNISGRAYRGAGAYFLSGNSPTFRNCIFRNNYAGVSGSALYLQGTSALIDNCQFISNNGTQGNTGQIAIYNSNSSTNYPVIQNSIIRNSNKNGIELNGSYTRIINNKIYSNFIAIYIAISDSVPSKNIIDRCEIYSNTTAFNVSQHYYYANTNNSTLIYNTLIRNNGLAFSFSGNSYYYSYYDIRNSTIVSNSTAFGGSVYGSAAIYNSIVWSNSTFKATAVPLTSVYSNLQNSISGTGNINTDPQFINAANGNYRLQPHSLSINTASSTYAYGDLDLDGNGRIYGPAIDMGAYEKIVDYDLDILSPTSNQEITIDTDFTISGISSNLSSVTAEISTNTVDWILLGTASVVGDAWSMTAQVSSTLFTAGVSSTIRVSSGIVSDSVEIVVANKFLLTKGTVYSTIEQTPSLRPTVVKIENLGKTAMFSNSQALGYVFYHPNGVFDNPTGVSVTNQVSCDYVEGEWIYGMFQYTIAKVKTNNTGYQDLYSHGWGWYGAVALTADENYFYVARGGSNNTIYRISRVGNILDNTWSLNLSTQIMTGAEAGVLYGHIISGLDYFNGKLLVFTSRTDTSYPTPGLMIYDLSNLSQIQKIALNTGKTSMSAMRYNGFYDPSDGRIVIAHTDYSTTKGFFIKLKNEND